MLSIDVLLIMAAEYEPHRALANFRLLEYLGQNTSGVPWDTRADGVTSGYKEVVLDG